MSIFTGLGASFRGDRDDAKTFDFLKKSKVWVVAGIVLLGAGLRLFWIGEKSLWLDEAFSLWVAGQPPGEMWRWLIRIDQHPPGYYALLAGWIRLFGTTETALRLLSALASIGTIPLVYAATRHLLDRPTAGMAALLLALSPFQIAYAQEARMYAWLTLAAALAILCVALLYRADWPSMGQRPAPWIGLILAEAGALWMHNTALFLPLALTGAALALRAPRRPWLMAQLGVLTLWLPWLPGFVPQVRSVADGFWIAPPTLDVVFWAVAGFGTDFLPDWLPWRWLWALPMMGVTVFGALHLARHPAHRPQLGALGSLILVPVLGSLAVSTIRPIFLPRTLLWVGLPYLILAAWGLRHLRPVPLGRGILGLSLGVILLGLSSYYVESPKEEWRDAAATVADQVAPGDLLLFNAGWTQLPFDYYFEQAAASAGVARRGLPVDLFERGELEPVMAPADLAYLADLIRNRAGVWLIYSHEGYTDPDGLIVDFLRHEMTLAEERSFVGVRVLYFVQ